MRKLVVPLVALALSFVGTPQAGAAAPVSITVAFVGGMTVTPGLCHLGFEESGGLCGPDTVDPMQADTSSIWSMWAPVPPPWGVCRIAIVYDDASAGEEVCDLDLDGRMTAALALVGPSCNLHSGTTAPDPTGGPDVISFGATVLPVTMSWAMAVSQVVPVRGTIGGLPYRGSLVMRPLNQNCLTTAASDFMILGELQASAV